MFKEFKSFALRGNVMDLAVGVIIGGAFGKIITSLVNDIITPVISVFMGGASVTGLQTRIGGTNTAPIELHWGSFMQAAIDFLLIAIVIFVIVKVINSFHAPAPEAPKTLTTDQQLLTEIRDSLKK